MSKTTDFSDQAVLGIYVGLRKGSHHMYVPRRWELVAAEHVSFDETRFPLANIVKKNDDVVFILDSQQDEEESCSEARTSLSPQEMHRLVRDTIEDRKKPAKRTNELIRKAVIEEKGPDMLRTSEKF